jgi:hypothetical protein
MDRFSTRTAQQGSGQNYMEGLININTAGQPVLELLPGMTPEIASALIAARGQLEPAQLQNAAWPLATGLVDTDTFHRMAPMITIKSYQYHVEILGYADHVNLFRRQEWIIEMIGPLAQIKYSRDLTPLGRAWPVDDDSIVVTNR